MWSIPIVQILQIIKKTCKFPLRYTFVKYLPHTDPIPAEHAESKCEVSRFYKSSRLYKNPSDHIDPANRTDRIPVKMQRSYRSHRFHSGRSYRSCISYRFCRSYISCRSYKSNPVKIYRSHRSHSGTQLWSIYLIQTPSRINMLQASAKYSDFTDPPDHTEIPKIIQILQIMLTHR